MKWNDIKIGQFFTISETPSYPKLRTAYGYIDARDEIKNEDVWVITGELRIMEDSEVLEQFKKFKFESLEEIQAMREQLLDY